MPSKTGEDTAASEPEQIQVLSLQPPSTGEQRLVVLAESLHISPQIPMSNTVTVQEATAPQQPFEVLDPITGRMMDPDNTAIHKAIGPDQPDPPPGRGPPRLPFPERGFLTGPPEGGGGFPGSEGPPGGGLPNAEPGGGGNPRQGSDKLVGNISHLKCSRKYKQKLSTSSLNGNFMSALTSPTQPSQTTTRGACSSSLISKEQECRNGYPP